MDTELDRRTYDLLRLVDRHGPIGSIQLVDLMQLRGYDIKDRTIRLKLAELDDLGLTEKVPGKGRQLTQTGRTELKQGDVDGRLEQIRARIATLTSRVSYDPIEDAGELVASAAYLDDDAIAEALEIIEQLEALPLGPVPVSLEHAAESEPGDYRLLAASSITLDGVLLAHGVNADLASAGVLEYEVAEDSEGECGGHITRYVDVLNGEGSSIDVISLLVEAGRSDIQRLIEGENDGLLIGDDREFPLNRYEEARDLTIATRAALGGVFDFQRPRETDGTVASSSGWAFGSVTYVGTGELVITALAEYGLCTEWETLYGMVERNRLDSIAAVRAGLRN